MLKIRHKLTSLRFTGCFLVLVVVLLLCVFKITNQSQAFAENDSPEIIFSAHDIELDADIVEQYGIYHVVKDNQIPDNVEHIGFFFESSYDFQKAYTDNGYEFYYNIDGAIRDKLTNINFSQNQTGKWEAGVIDVHKLDTDYLTGKSSGTVTIEIYRKNSPGEDILVASKDFNLEVEIIVPHFKIISVSQSNQQLQKKWEKGTHFNMDSSRGEDAFYYYENPLSDAKVNLEIQLDGLEDGKIYKINEEEITATDNGTTKTVVVTPRVEWWSPKYSNEYTAAISLCELYDPTNCSSHIQNETLVFRPQAQGTENIRVISVKQNNTELQFQDGAYQAPKYNMPIEVTYEVSGLDANMSYTSYSSLGNSGGCRDDGYGCFEINDKTSDSFTASLNFDTTIQKNDFSVMLYANDTDGNFSQYSHFSQYYRSYINIADPDFVELGEIKIDSITQGGETVVAEYMDDRFLFNLNDVQDFTVNLHVDQAVDSLEYGVRVSVYSENTQESIESQWYTLTGESLKNGLPVTLLPKYESNSTYYLTIDKQYGNNSSRSATFSYSDGINSGRAVHINFKEDENLPRFDYTIKYSNGLEPKQSDNTINPKYHKEGHPLIFVIDGDRFDNSQTYDVKIDIQQTDYPYSITIQKTGAELNNGTEIELSNFTMQLFELSDLTDYSYDVFYTVTVNIAGSKQKKILLYTYDFNTTKTTILYSNGQFSATSAGSKGGDPYRMSKGTTISAAAFNAENAAILYYSFGDLDEEKTFNYTISYGDGTELLSGQMSGAELNAGQLRLELSNPNNHTKLTYKLILRDGQKVVYTMRDDLHLWDGAGILSTSLSTSNTLYLKSDMMQFYAPHNNNITIKMTGVNFDPTKQYEIIESIGANNNQTGVSASFDNIATSKTYSGQALNDGEVSFVLKYDERFKNYDYLWVHFLVKDSDGNTYPGNSFSVYYVDIAEVLTINGNYNINNETGSIRKISKQTLISDLANVLAVTDGGKIKVYDKDGETEQTELIGTGMKVRLMDKYGNPIIDIDAVVTGDVTGDGKITATDLARERQHLAEIRELEGVYKMAGNINNTGDITATDLARMRQDIAGIREMK